MGRPQGEEADGLVRRHCHIRAELEDTVSRGRETEPESFLKDVWSIRRETPSLANRLHPMVVTDTGGQDDRTS